MMTATAHVPAGGQGSLTHNVTMADKSCQTRPAASLPTIRSLPVIMKENRLSRYWHTTCFFYRKVAIKRSIGTSPCLTTLPLAKRATSRLPSIIVPFQRLCIASSPTPTWRSGHENREDHRTHSIHLPEGEIDGMRLPKMRNPSPGEAFVDRQRDAPQVLSGVQALLEFHQRHRTFRREQTCGGRVVFLFLTLTGLKEHPCGQPLSVLVPAVVMTREFFEIPLVSLTETGT